MHSLFALAPYLREEQFLLSTVDPVFEEKEFENFLHYARQHPLVDGILAVTQFIDDENPLFVQLANDHRILNFSKSEQSHWITGGMYIFSPTIFRDIDTVLKNKIERLRNFLKYLIEKGYQLEGYPFSKIVDVDHLRDIRVAEELLRAR